MIYYKLKYEKASEYSVYYKYNFWLVNIHNIYFDIDFTSGRYL